MAVRKILTAPVARPGLPRKLLFSGGATMAIALCIMLFGTQLMVYQARLVDSESAPRLSGDQGPDPFPVGVDPRRKLISENPNVEVYFGEQLPTRSLARHGDADSWFGRVFSTLAQSSIYQSLASPSARVLIIRSGERKEEVVSHFARILGWDKAKRDAFLAAVGSSSPAITDGTFMPSMYVTADAASPEEVAAQVTQRFQTEVGARYTPAIENVVPMKDALTIASLLEREAYDFDDMRNISGIIWNRLFAGMNLQIDATLQYAKGSKPNQPWWPRVVPDDKNIKSDFNTYKNGGLPPGPIANPSLDAILAALNPKKTDCMYYFHDADGGFHCSVTYEEHVAALKQYYGRGK